MRAIHQHSESSIPEEDIWSQKLEHNDVQIQQQ